MAVAVTSLLKGGFVKSRLDADLKDEWEVLALKASRLHPCVGQPRVEEVSEIEPQLSDDCKNAKRVDEKPAIWSTTEPPHFQRLSEVSNGLVVGSH